MAETHVKVVNRKSGMPQIMLKSNWDNINQNNPKQAENLEFMHECDEVGNASGAKQEVKRRTIFDPRAEKAIVEFEGLLKKSEDAAKDGDLDLAKEHAQKALAMSPTSEVAKMILSHINSEIEFKNSNTSNHEQENNSGNGTNGESNNGSDKEEIGGEQNELAGELASKLAKGKTKASDKSAK